MPRNPIFNDGTRDAQNNGLTHRNKAADPHKNYRQGMNYFNNSYDHATTERFGDVSPFMVLDVVPRDEIKFRSNHRLSSYTLQSPMMDKINKHKFYSIVPYRTILPNTWELIYTNPTKGDDVPDDIYCNVDIIRSYFNHFQQLYVSDTPQETLFNLIESIICAELIFSTGSLLTLLKYNFWSFMYKDKSINFDNWFNNNFVDFVSKHIVLNQVLYEGSSTPISCSDETFAVWPNSRRVSVNYFLDVLRNGDYQQMYYVGENAGQSFNELNNSFGAFFASVRPELEDVDPEIYPFSTYKVDISRAIAYQITCISQVTDPSIDYLFNANLFRNVLFPQTEVKTFTWNSQVLLYDTFSRKYLEEVWFAPDNFVATCQKLFSYAKSLKFGDYFTQSRPQPYGQGNLEIDTSDGLDAIEVTRKIVYQRFLNWNNRVGPKYEDYKKELDGMAAMSDPTEPSLINHSQDVVGSYNVENTGSDQFSKQNSVTTLLRDNGSKFGFDIVVSENSIVLGLTSYDMKRLYTRGMDRANLKEDRFDFFNHMLQYTGDQDIKACEIDATRGDEPIAYTTKDMHYKMQVSHASGGFISDLPSWAFTTEETDTDMRVPYGINPQFIRNTNSDFDRFYSSLSGHSLGTYYHFIIKYDNDFSDMKRAMDVAPDIL